MTVVETHKPFRVIRRTVDRRYPMLIPPPQSLRQCVIPHTSHFGHAPKVQYYIPRIREHIQFYGTYCIEFVRHSGIGHAKEAFSENYSCSALHTCVMIGFFGGVAANQCTCQFIGAGKYHIAAVQTTTKIERKKTKSNTRAHTHP